MKKKVCEFCGASISRNDIFCRGCGTKVNNNEIIKDAVIEGENKNNNNSGFILGIIVSILAIMVLLGLFYLFK